MANGMCRLIEEEPTDPNANYRRFFRVNFQADYEPLDRFELFLLDDGEKKVEWKDETRA